jgi:hypothetical protein
MTNEQSEISRLRKNVQASVFAKATPRQVGAPGRSDDRKKANGTGLKAQGKSKPLSYKL